MYGGGIQRGGPPRGQINPNQGNSNNANMNQQQFMAGMRGNFPNNATQQQQQQVAQGNSSSGNMSSWDQYFNQTTTAKPGQNPASASMFGGPSGGSMGNMLPGQAPQQQQQLQMQMLNNANSSYLNSNPSMSSSISNSNNPAAGNAYNPMMYGSNSLQSTNAMNMNMMPNSMNSFSNNNNSNLSNSNAFRNEYDPYAANPVGSMMGNFNPGMNTSNSSNVNNSNNAGTPSVQSAIAEAAAKAFLMRSASSNAATTSSNISNNPANSMNNNPALMMQQNLNSTNNNFNSNNNNNMNMSSYLLQQQQQQMNMNNNFNSNNNFNNNTHNNNFNNNNNNMNSMNQMNNLHMMNMSKSTNNNMMMMLSQAGASKPAPVQRTRWSAMLEQPLHFPNTFAKQNKPSPLFVASLLRHQQYHQQQQGSSANTTQIPSNLNVHGAGTMTNSNTNANLETAAVLATALPPEIAPLVAALSQQQQQLHSSAVHSAPTTSRGSGGVIGNKRERSESPSISSPRPHRDQNRRGRSGGRYTGRSRSRSPPPLSNSGGGARHGASSSRQQLSLGVPIPSNISNTNHTCATMDTLIKHQHFPAFLGDHGHEDGDWYSALELHWRFPQLFLPPSFSYLQASAMSQNNSSNKTMNNVWLSATQAVPLHYETSSSSVTSVISSSLVNNPGVHASSSSKEEKKGLTHSKNKAKYSVKVLLSFGVKEHEVPTSTSNSFDCHVMRKWRVLTVKPRHVADPSIPAATCVLLGGEYSETLDTPFSEGEIHPGRDTFGTLLSTARRCVQQQCLFDLCPSHTAGSTDTLPEMSAEGIWEFEGGWYKTCVVPLGIVHYRSEQEAAWKTFEAERELEAGEDVSMGEDSVSSMREHQQENEGDEKEEEQVVLFAVMVLPHSASSSLNGEERDAVVEDTYAKQYAAFVERMSTSATANSAPSHATIAGGINEANSDEDATEDAAGANKDHPKADEDQLIHSEAESKDAEGEEEDNADGEEEMADEAEGDNSAENATKASTTQQNTTGSTPASATPVSNPTSTTAVVMNGSNKAVITKPSQLTILLAPTASWSLRVLPLSALLSYSLATPSDRTRDTFETALAAELFVTHWTRDGLAACVRDVLVAHGVATQLVTRLRHHLACAAKLSPPPLQQKAEEDSEKVSPLKFPLFVMNGWIV